MRIRQTCGLALFAVMLATPCQTIDTGPPIWSKKPKSLSKLFAFEREGLVGFIDHTGKIAIPAKLQSPIASVGDFSEGLARIPGHGFIDERGNLRIPGTFDWADDFSDGLAKVSVSDSAHAQVTQYIDTAGKAVLTSIREAGSFSEGLAVIEGEARRPMLSGSDNIGERYSTIFPPPKGLIDRSGRVVVKPIHSNIGPFVNGLARVVLDGQCYVAAPEGRREPSPTAGGDPRSCPQRPAANGGVPCGTGFLDRSGKFVIQPKFESARDFEEGLAAVQVDGLWGFIDAKGTMVIKPAYQQALSFSEGLAAVQLPDTTTADDHNVSGKWGFIDRRGHLVIQPRFERAESFSGSLAIATGNAYRRFYIDRRGVEVLTGDWLEMTPFVHGLAAVRGHGPQVRYINKQGKTVFAYDRTVN